METVNRVVVSGLVFGPVEFTEPDRGPAHARFCLSQEKPAGSRRVEQMCIRDRRWAGQCGQGRRDERERQHGRERGVQGGRGPRRAPIFSR